jgi:hypothetical protein
LQTFWRVLAGAAGHHLLPYRFIQKAFQALHGCLRPGYYRAGLWRRTRLIPSPNDLIPQLRTYRLIQAADKFISPQALEICFFCHLCPRK